MKFKEKITRENLEKHIDNVTKSKKLFVFLGFSPEELIEVSDYKLLQDKFPQRIEEFNHNPEVISHIFPKMTDERLFYWCTAEEYQFYIENQFVNYFDIQFLYNNLYHSLFPIFYSFDNFDQVLRDYEDDDQEIKSSNFESINKFYGNIVYVDSQLYGTYSFDEEILSNLNPYFTNVSLLNLKSSEVQAYDLTFEIQENQNSFLMLMNKLINSTHKQLVNIVHSNDSEILINEYLQRLSTLVHLNSNIKIFFTKKSLDLTNIDESKYLKILDEYWGFSSFRSLKMYKDPDNSKELIDVKQSQIIHDIVEEIENAQQEKPFRDIFITSSTGAGKSVMFQLPSFLMHKNHQLLTIVISPLIGLMNDQVKNLQARGINNVATINSNITPMEKEEIQRRIHKKEIAILYISPETLLNRADIKLLIGEETKVGLFIVDEAHIVTTWGKAFRADYWYLGPYLQKLRKEMKFPIATFTATAIYGGEEDMYKETRDSLGLLNPKFYLGQIKRNDIEMKIDSHPKELSTNEYRIAKFDFASLRLKSFIKNEKKVLVYFPTIPLINQLQTYIDEQHPRLSKQIVTYYGSLPKAHKEENHYRFSRGDSKIMFATKAYGMGIDLPDIDIVYHYAPTGNVCDYVQEIGRAARDEQLNGQAYFDFLKNDFSHIKRLHGMSTIRKTQLQQVSEKIYKIYKEKKKSRNLLVSVEDFSHIFTSNNGNEDTDVEGKLKTSLLLIEKDFINRLGFAPFVARPRGLFSREYFKVTAKGEKLLHQVQNKEYVKYIKTIDHDHYNKIYEIDLKKIWEKKYRNLSFPNFKRKFHDRDHTINLNFLDEIDSTFIVNFQSKNSLEHSLTIFSQRLQTISGFFSNYALTRSFFKNEDLTVYLEKELKLDKYNASNLSQIILQSMIRYTSLRLNTNSRSVIHVNENKSYRITPSYEDFFKFVLQQANIYFDSKWTDKQPDSSYNVYLSKSVRDAINRSTLTFGLLEGFGLINYQIQGGNTPEIYIRINSTLQLESLIKNPSKYQNKILNDVHYRHKLSNEMLKYIFENKMTTEVFWDVIEDYFLGKIPEQVISAARTK